jgi:hypothetical protein
MRLKDERDAFNCGGVSALTAFHETLLEEFLGISELRDALAGGAFAAEIVREALAVCGLREHARERELADSTGTGEEQRVGDASAAESTAEGGDEAFVAEKFRKAHR